MTLYPYTIISRYNLVKIAPKCHFSRKHSLWWSFCANVFLEGYNPKGSKERGKNGCESENEGKYIQIFHYYAGQSLTRKDCINRVALEKGRCALEKSWGKVELKEFICWPFSFPTRLPPPLPWIPCTSKSCSLACVCSSQISWGLHEPHCVGLRC